MSCKSEFNWPVRVYFEDTDAGGIVYHANYLKFFERARTEWFRELGLHLDVLMKQNITFVIRHIDMNYRLSIRFNEQLTVKSTILSLHKASLVFEQSIINASAQTACHARIKVACVDAEKMKALKLPDSISEVLKIVV